MGSETVSLVEREGEFCLSVDLLRFPRQREREIAGNKALCEGPAPPGGLTANGTPV